MEVKVRLLGAMLTFSTAVRSYPAEPEVDFKGRIASGCTLVDGMFTMRFVCWGLFILLGDGRGTV